MINICMTNITEQFVDVDGETLLEISLSNMKNNVIRDFGRGREQRSNKVQVSNYHVIPSVNERTLLIKARIVGEESKYDVQIRFINVFFSDEPRAGYTEVKAMDGRTYYIKQFTASQTQARVKCTCLDFHYRFSLWNHGKRALEGDPPAPYIKKTDSAPVNPNRVPGSCKHILKLVNFLKGEQIVR